jgi:hypothetical protein
MHLTGGLSTASGVLHEIDLVAQNVDVVAVLELKNRLAYPPDKNDVIVFFAKLLDYLALNPVLLHREVIPMFISTKPKVIVSLKMNTNHFPAQFDVPLGIQEIEYRVAFRRQFVTMAANQTCKAKMDEFLRDFITDRFKVPTGLWEQKA